MPTINESVHIYIDLWGSFPNSSVSVNCGGLDRDFVARAEIIYKVILVPQLQTTIPVKSIWLAFIFMLCTRCDGALEGGTMRTDINAEHPLASIAYQFVISSTVFATTLPLHQRRRVNPCAFLQRNSAWRGTCVQIAVIDLWLLSYAALRNKGALWPWGCTWKNRNDFYKQSMRPPSFSIVLSIHKFNLSFTSFLKPLSFR